MSIYWNDHRKKWAYTFRINRQRYTGYCEHPDSGEPAKSKTEARKIETLIKARIQQRLEKGEAGKEPDPLPAAGFTLAEPLSYYLEKLKGKSSFSGAKGYTEELLNFFGAETPMDEIEDRIHAYIEFAKRQKVRSWAGTDKEGNVRYKESDRLRSAKTINEYLNYLVRAYRAFKKAPHNKNVRHFIPEPPEFEHLKVMRRTPTPVPYNVTKRYLEAFDETLHAHLRLAYILCVQTGMRANECAQIREKQYYEAERVILLTPEQTKSDTGRPVHVNEIAHKAILECRKLGDYLWELLQEFPHLAAEYQEKYGITARGDISFILYRRKGTGVPRPVKHISSSGWKRIKKEVGINYRWHDTRAAFCTDALGSHGDINAVRQLAGHQDIQTTQKYLYASDPRLRETVKALATARPMEVPTECLTKVSYKVEKALQLQAQPIEKSSVSA